MIDKLFKKPFSWAITFTVILTVFTAFVLMDTFVFAKALASVPQEQSVITLETVTAETTENISTEIETVTAESIEPAVTDTSYEDENIKIEIQTIYVYDTAVYIANVQLSDASYLKTALASDTYGRNIKDTTSEIAEENDAVFAINGDFYGFRDYGFVLRNGVLYRTSASDENEDEALLIDTNGNMLIINENDTSDEDLAVYEAWQVLSFGPALISGGEICVDKNSEVGKSMSSNPRTAIGQISELNYLFIVSDGRTDESEGLSLYELAQIFDEYGCSVAYNLDGGGSSTMWFNGEVINIPTSGRNFGERSVSDIVYIG